MIVNKLATDKEAETNEAPQTSEARWPVHCTDRQRLHRGENPCENTPHNTTIYHFCQNGQRDDVKPLQSVLLCDYFTKLCVHR